MKKHSDLFIENEIRRQLGGPLCGFSLGASATSETLRRRARRLTESLSSEDWQGYLELEKRSLIAGAIASCVQSAVLWIGWHKTMHILATILRILIVLHEESLQGGRE